MVHVVSDTPWQSSLPSLCSPSSTPSLSSKIINSLQQSNPNLAMISHHPPPPDSKQADLGLVVFLPVPAHTLDSSQEWNLKFSRWLKGLHTWNLVMSHNAPRCVQVSTCTRWCVPLPLHNLSPRGNPMLIFPHPSVRHLGLCLGLCLGWNFSTRSTLMKNPSWSCTSRQISSQRP